MNIYLNQHSMLLHLLQTPLAHTSYETAEKSRWTWGETGDPELFRLTPLGILHTLTGLTIYTELPPEAECVADGLVPDPNAGA